MKQQQDINALTTAFSDLTSIIAKFEDTYKVLQGKVDQLTQQLEHKNTELEKRIIQDENNRNFLNSILENIYTGVLVIDNVGTIIIFNKAAENITGFEKEIIIGNSYLKVFADQKNLDSKSAIYTLTTQKESYHRNREIIASDGTIKNVEYSTSLIYDQKSQVLGVVEIFNDISEIKKLQERILHIETLAALGEMSASVAHEIRNPLGGIGGFAGLLDRQLSTDDPRKKLVKPIIEGVHKLNNIVSNLLTLTRPQKIHPSQVVVSEILNEIIEFFRIGIMETAKKVELTTEFADQRTIVLIDIQLFHQVIINILKNAFDAIEETGSIHIQTRLNIPEPNNDFLEEEEINELIRLFSYIEIIITDTGKGMSEEQMLKIFNPFFTTKDEGNGLGLAICKKIIQLHRGDIHFHSQLGVGTSFIITLPLYESYE